MYTLEEKYQLIKEEILKQDINDPIRIVKTIMHKDYINMHGPEHHFLDAASFLIAYKNAGGDINIIKSLDLLKERTIKMPGGMCGNWGVCGSVSAIGAALSIIHNVSPLANTDYYRDDMEYTSLVLKEMSQIGGPRCCKRNAYLAISLAVKFVRDKYGIVMEIDNLVCEFSNNNEQCLKEKCPFNSSNLLKN